MRLAYLDCFSGISGDMLLGALIDAGAPLAAVERAVRGLGLRGVRVATRRVMRAGFAATKFDVLVKSGGRVVEGGGHGVAPGHAHAQHGHGGGHDHDYDYDHDGGHRHAHDGGAGRGRSPHAGKSGPEGHSHAHPHVPASDILARIRRGRLSARVKEQAGAIFERLARAEAKAHGTPFARVHFHEVGAADSIVDVVGAAAALEALGIEEIHSSPLPLSRGHVHGAHGTIPVPGPATLQLLKGLPVTPVEVEGELVTPTGAAIVATLARRDGACPDMRIRAVGTGAGTRDPAGRPNVMRVIVGETAPAPESDVVWVVETNVDDVSGEVVGHVLGRMFAAGAVDAWTVPIQMKKSRPGVLVSALCPPSALPAVERVLFRETATFGVRRHLAVRSKLNRRLVPVRTPHGIVRVKAGCLRGELLTVSPEFEDCRAASERRGVPLRDVMRAAVEAYHVTARGRGRRAEKL